VQIVCNGQERTLPPGATIAALLEELELRGPVAVEVNFELAPRERHAQWQLCDGDQLEVVTLVGGG
jgi:sulfur carrier protein